MENHQEDTAGIETEEEFPDEFQCCVCLDLLYKPVVLACGHISCFWCVFGAMDTWQESHCPICRHPYNHFPSICQLLHFLLLKLYPIGYKRRERQVTEEEKRSEWFSPQFDNHLSDSQPSKEMNIYSGVSPHSSACSFSKLSLGSCSTGEREPSVIKDSAESTIECHRDDRIFITVKSTYEATEDVATDQNSTRDYKLVQQNSRQVLINDLLCAICKELLYRPVVLNCGHVYCEACIISPGDKVPICQVCQSMHPNGYPKVCLVLEHFLEEQFSEQYALREKAVFKQVDSQYGAPPTLPGATQAHKYATQLSSISTNDLSRQSGQGPEIHTGFGCDYCGIYPIIGVRYTCKDCSEKIGFDLCESCYNSSSKLPGRFNQQHTPEHKLEIAQPPNIVWILEAEESEEDSDAPEEMEDVPPAPILSADAPRDPDDGAAVPTDNTLEDQEGTQSTISNC